MTRECLVLWVPANDLLADASFDLSKAAKDLYLDAKLFLLRVAGHTLGTASLISVRKQHIKEI